jgi:hypothetical protein
MTKKPVRISLEDGLGNRSFIVVSDGRVCYMSDRETPLALSNIALQNAAELRFALQDARSAHDCMAAVRKMAVGARKVVLL